MPASSNPRCLSIDCPNCGQPAGRYCWRAIVPTSMGPREIPGACWHRITASRAPALPDYRNAIGT